MLLPELLSKVQELEAISECPLTCDVFPGAFVEIQQMSNRLTGRRHRLEITERLETIQRKQARWTKNRLESHMSVV
jgi:hypothetical protein